MAVRSVDNWLVTIPESLIGPTDLGTGNNGFARLVHADRTRCGARILEAAKCAERTVESLHGDSMEGAVEKCGLGRSATGFH
jgi:hypothetical protein